MDREDKIKEIIKKADFSKDSSLKDTLLKQLLEFNRNLEEDKKEDLWKEKGKDI